MDVDGEPESPPPVETSLSFGVKQSNLDGIIALSQKDDGVGASGSVGAMVVPERSDEGHCTKVPVWF